MNGDRWSRTTPMTVLGAGLLWFGWFGFNAGSVAANARGRAFTVTTSLPPPPSLGPQRFHPRRSASSVPRRGRQPAAITPASAS
jgi:hypothetical protein